MEKEIYTAQERNLIMGAQLLEQSLLTKEKLTSLLALDKLLLEMEEQQDMLDGLKQEVYLL